MASSEGRASLSRSVFDAIRTRILDGRLRPGETLSERDLGTELDVSRVPIREALPLLEAAGLVTLSPRRPAVVTAVTKSSVNELYDIRSALEPLVARKAAAAVAKGANAQTLVGAVVEAGDALRRGDLIEFHYASSGVHSGIEALSANRLFPVIMEPLRERSNRLNVANLERDPSLRHSEHVSLVDAIANGDSELSAAIAYAHVEWGRARTFETLSAVPGYDPEG
ncbi:MAG: GntR family transcriptional regulator [Rhodococcus sp. (in: high G+C Gram-positive bacteria)]